MQAERDEATNETPKEASNESEDQNSDEMVRFSVSMPASLARELDLWRQTHGYASRSEAVRDLIRDLMVTKQWEGSAPEEEMVGVVTLVYKHTTRELSENLMTLQHHHHAVMQSALHVHLNFENCLEAIVLQGKKSEVVHLAQRLISAKGVLHGQVHSSDNRRRDRLNKTCASSL